MIPEDIPGADIQVLLLVVLWHRKERSVLLTVNDFSHQGQIVANTIVFKVVPGLSLDVAAMFHTYLTLVSFQLIVALIQLLNFLILLIDFILSCRIDLHSLHFSLLAQICAHKVFDGPKIVMGFSVIVVGYDKTLFHVNLDIVIVFLIFSHFRIDKILCISMVNVALAIVNKS